MLNRLREWWLGFGGKKADMVLTEDQIDLLKSLRRDVIPDPEVLTADHRRLTAEIATGDADWERYDRRGDPSSYLKLQPLAERLEALRARTKKLPAQIASAQQRQSAFLELAEQFFAIGDDVQARLDALLDHPPPDEDARLAAVRELDSRGRLWVRIAWVLQSVSTSRDFKEPQDVLKVLREELENRAREVELLRVPGNKPRFVAPPEIAALMAALEGRTQKEITHAVR